MGTPRGVGVGVLLVTGHSIGMALGWYWVLALVALHCIGVTTLYVIYLPSKH